MSLWMIAFALILTKPNHQPATESAPDPTPLGIWLTHHQQKEPLPAPDKCCGLHRNDLVKEDHDWNVALPVPAVWPNPFVPVNQIATACADLVYRARPVAGVRMVTCSPSALKRAKEKQELVEPQFISEGHWRYVAKLGIHAA